VAPLLPMLRERLPTLAEVGAMADFLFVNDLRVEPDLLVPKRWDAATTTVGLKAARAVIADVGAVSFEADELEGPLRTLAEERGWKVGDLFMAIRVAVTGRTATPPLFDTLVALGYSRTLERLDAARDALESLAP
jgi:glutamyl-tRNA synthetase